MRFRVMSVVFAPFVLLILLIASCQKGFHQPNEHYVFVAANINLPYWQEAQAGFKAAARELGVEAEFLGPTSYSPDEELTTILNAIDKRPAGILISPARTGLFNAAIGTAIAAGIPVICVDSDAPQSRRLLFVGTDNVRAGIQSGTRMAELLHGQGRVVVITIPGQFNLDERLRGVNEAFDRYPKIKVLQVFDDKGDPRRANEQVSALLEKKEKIDGIVCLEASGGPGAAEALHRLNLGGKIFLVAMDKNPNTLDWIGRGVISATIAQKPYTMSFYGLKFLDDLHHNFNNWQSSPDSPLPAGVDTGTIVVDQRNLAAFRAAGAARSKPLEQD